MIRFLQSGHKLAKYLISGFLMVLCVGMVLYLIPGFMSGADSTVRTGVVASIGGADIATDQVKKMAQPQLAQKRAQMRGQELPEFLTAMIMQQAAQFLIEQAEINYAARRLGIKVSDREVQDELQQNPEYKQAFFPGGQWIGEKEYEALLTRNGGTVADFEQYVRDTLLQRKLFSTITAGAAVTPDEVEKNYRDQNLKVKFQYAFLKLDDVKKEIKPTETELSAYYKANQQVYQNTIPEKRQVRYIVLQDKDAESKVSVEPAELQSYYTSHQDAYRTPERVKVRHILIAAPKPGPDGKVDQKGLDDARAKAEDVLRQVKAGGNFAELANKYSQDPGNQPPGNQAKKGGELGWIQRGNFVPEFEKAAFDQSPGQISGLVQTIYGFHIIQTEEKDPARVKPLAEVKNDIEKLKKKEKVNAFVDQVFTAAQATAQKQGLDKAASEHGLQVVQSNPVSRTDSLPGIGNSAPEVMSAIFGAADKSGAQSARFAQGYVIFEVTKIEPPRTPPLEEIRERVTNDFKSQRGRELLTKKTQEMADRAHSQHDLAKAAKEAGATLKTSDLVGRSDQVGDAGSMGGSLSAAFALKPGEISGPLNSGEKGVVVQVTDRQEASLTDGKFSKDRDGIVEQLSRQRQSQALQLFFSNLQTRMEKEGKIKINKKELENLARGRG
jgi:peptidyl-prolyl cis-trans isomerase D